MSKEQAQKPFSNFDLIGYLVIITIIFGGIQLINSKSKRYNLEKKAVYQEVIYLGNDGFLQCVNNKYLTLNSRNIIVADNYTPKTLLKLPESCTSEIYNYSQMNKMKESSSFIRIDK